MTAQDQISHRTLLRGGSLMFAGQLLRTGITIGSNVVVARLLSPKDYGVFAIAALVSGFLLQFASFRVHLAVLQRKHVSDEQLSTLFWIQLVWSLILSLACWLAGPLLAKWFREPAAAGLFGLLSLTLPLNAAYGWHLTILRRELRFRTVAAIDVSAFLLSTIVVIACAWRGLGFWALALGVVAERVIGAVITWTRRPWLPGPPRRGTGIRSFIGFGANFTLSGLLSYATRNVDNALIGWRWGASLLGEYARAYAVFISPLSQLFPPLHEVMVPILSRAQDREEELVRLFTLAVRLLSWLTMPLTIFILVAADPLISVLLGSKWGGSVPILRWLCVGGTIQAVHASLGWLYIARAKPEAAVRFGTLSALVTVGSFLVGLPFGPRYVAASYSLAVWCLAAAYYVHASRSTGLNLRPMLSTLTWPGIACCILLPVGLLVASHLTALSAVVQLAALGALAVVVCGAVLIVSGDGRRAVDGLALLRRSRAT